MSAPADNRNPVDQPEFGPALRQLRESRHMSKAELARRTSVDPSHITRLEQSERGVSRDTVEKLCAALDATQEEMRELLQASGFLSPDLAQLLSQPELAALAALLGSDDLTLVHRDLLVRHLRLALDVATALGYQVTGQLDTT
jgi:transcriptional regulator with XRE-family HTH domain